MDREGRGFAREARHPGLRPCKALTGTRRALVVSSTPVAPLLGGASTRIRTLLGALETIGFEVHFAFIERDPGDKDAMQAMFGGRFHPIPYRRQRAETSVLARARRYLLKAIGADAGWLWGVDDIYDSGVEPELARLQERFGFDVVIVEYVFFSRALGVFGPDVRRLIDMHDVFGNRHRAYLAAGQRSHWLSVRPEDEIRALRRADHVLAIQPDEAKLIRKRGISEVDWVSHLVSLADGPGEVPEAPTVLFVGAANDSNAHGLRWFVTRVWPLVLRSCPTATFHVAGAVSDTCPRAPGVHVEGRVSDDRLAALYACARVAVNPVFTGSGQSVKVLEAMGHGVPVVASTTGLRGITGAGDPGVQLADDPVAFAQALVRLCRDDAYAAHARGSAWAFAGRSNARQLAVLGRACGVAIAPRAGTSHSTESHAGSLLELRSPADSVDAGPPDAGLPVPAAIAATGH